MFVFTFWSLEIWDWLTSATGAQRKPVTPSTMLSTGPPFHGSWRLKFEIWGSGSKRVGFKRFRDWGFEFQSLT